MLDKIFEKLGDDILNDDAKQEITTAFNEAIEAQVKAQVDLNSVAIEEEAAKKYEAEIKEMEDHTFEEVKKFKASIEEQTIEAAKEHSEKVIKETAEFKEEMTDKLDSYIESQLEKAIPEELKEAMAQNAIYAPIVEGITKLFADNYLKVDEEGYNTLKEASAELDKAKEKENDLMSEIVAKDAELKALKVEAKINEVTEGLTDEQTERAKVLLKDQDLDKIEEHYKSIQNVIIEGVNTDSEKVEIETDSISDESEIVDDVIKENEDKDDDNVLTEMDEYREELDRQIKE